MKVIDSEPHSWFLLKEGDRYYMDARVTRSAVDWSVLVELSPQEYREYHAMGKVFLEYLAARIHNFTEEYQGRDLSKTVGERVHQTIVEWRAGYA